MNRRLFQNNDQIVARIFKTKPETSEEVKMLAERGYVERDLVVGVEIRESVVNRYYDEPNGYIEVVDTLGPDEKRYGPRVQS